MSATDPWADEWAAMSYSARLSWWWSARGAYQSQEDWAAGKEAPAGVSCKYGIPGAWPGSRTPYVKEAPKEITSEETTKTEESEAPTTEEPKTDEVTTEATKAEAEATTPEPPKEETRSTVNLTIPPSSNSIHVSKKKNKNKGKNKH